MAGKLEERNKELTPNDPGTLPVEGKPRNSFQVIFDTQRDHFNSDATKSYEWRIEQLDRMARMLKENDDAFQEAVSKNFKTALEEKVFEVMALLATIQFTKMELREWMKPLSVAAPKALAASEHTAQVIREPYGVTLIIGSFNGPLSLLLHPAITALSAGNPCILKFAESIPATTTLLKKFIPKYFEPEAVAGVSGTREEVTELLRLPFDFIFFTGSVKVVGGYPHHETHLAHGKCGLREAVVSIACASQADSESGSLESLRGYETAASRRYSTAAMTRLVQTRSQLVHALAVRSRFPNRSAAMGTTDHAESVPLNSIFDECLATPASGHQTVNHRPRDVC